MANKEKIDYLLLDIQRLETLIAGMRDAEIYPAAFFGQSFDLTHKILKDLHALESTQLEILRKQLEEHQALLQSIPPSIAAPMPEPLLPVAEPEPVKEIMLKVPTQEIPTQEPKVMPIETIQVPEKKQQPEIIEQPKTESVTSTASTERSGLFLNDLLEKRQLSDFRKALSLNDRFRFRRELFGGDEERMNKAMNDLNNLHSYEDSISYLNNELKWNIEDEAVTDFIKLLEKRFL